MKSGYGMWVCVMKLIGINSDEERIKFFVVIASFIMLSAIYLFNATNSPESSDIPTELIVSFASLIVGYYFGRGKK